MRVTRDLPTNYRQQASLDLTTSRKAVIGVIFSGIVMLFTVGWMLLQFTSSYRPSAYEGLEFLDLFNNTSGTFAVTFTSQFLMDIVLALVLVLFIHELVHGLLYWQFTGKCPAFGIKGIFIYVKAPSEFYFPRNQYLIVGMGPLFLLTPIGLMLIVIVPEVVVQILIFFIAFNVAGAVGDLFMVTHLLSYSPKTYLQDIGTGVLIYMEPLKKRACSI
jgi:hypothetical protein